MIAVQKEHLTEDEVRELFEYYTELESEKMSESEARKRNMLKHFQLSLLSLATTSV